ncbi:uncharacterized protein MONOS_2528 [Monocercomonoides exilis]|uniref:uncharacterized protein n=1 Tax=Monocercomonoides exilis TaxID=2049356 RepID=UPI00355A9E91|nr:hypothetical protein MONOS_2528 [Monocercomonoides exilis]|eukprot:MONOS_2528.1-p1 / transcript=MONOS_2528.1 / gene=MONOS_2528 / organism=Monocercomonoides_exilis_PA203 / gene_product=unspecified product / transcript_product=unspecified product / location=Mono_scaffold00052:148459-149047(-) / protein_length=100 / sequence_SO=supercontig / SO=protein_coding / is_pseudo=false
MGKDVEQVEMSKNDLAMFEESGIEGGSIDLEKEKEEEEEEKVDGYMNVGVVEPHCWNGDWVMALLLKKTTFTLPSVTVLPSKKQNVMNFTPFIHEYVSL